ncbi:MAG: histidinol-phosphatase HisJ family protein [Eubacterium sp.]|nr:histidinol-phosphatase HisJ family protein [Eubacterium sp.]
MPAFKTNYHTHSTYCDGESNLREIAEQAARFGMTELGFSGHSYTSIDESYCMSQDGMQAYYDEVGILAEEYGPRLRILRGIEMDYFSNPEDYSYDWDHIICSCHYIKKNGEIFPVDESEDILMDACSKYYSGDIYSLIDDYYNEVGNVADVVRAGCITAESSADAALIIGHFDLITKFNEGGRLFDESDPRYVSAWTGALDRLCGQASSEAARNTILFEINTGAMSRGYRTAPYPSKEILAEIAHRGMSVILSSDSHEKSTLTYGFDEAYELAAECGVNVLHSIG